MMAQVPIMNCVVPRVPKASWFGPLLPTAYRSSSGSVPVGK